MDFKVKNDQLKQKIDQYKKLAMSKVLHQAPKQKDDTIEDDYDSVFSDEEEIAHLDSKLVRHYQSESSPVKETYCNATFVAQNSGTIPKSSRK